LGEIVNLKWREVDAKGGCFRLIDSKEGAAVRPVGRALLHYIAAVKRAENCPSVLSPARSGEVFGGLPKGWKRIARSVGLEDVTPHTLRHSFASVAGDLGYRSPPSPPCSAMRLAPSPADTSTTLTVC
jgi:integrase